METKSETTYEKNTGYAGDDGIKFQVDLLMVFLLNALKKFSNTDWRLSTENKKAGKFDDMVIELCDKSAVLLQAKQKKNKNTINFNDMVSASKNDDFSLVKYFLSYQEIKNEFKVKNIILCTNADVHGNILQFLNRQRIYLGSMLHYGDDSYSFYTVNESITPYLKKGIRDHYKLKNKKDIDEAVISDKNLSDFLIHFQFFANYPNSTKLKNVLQKKLSTLKHSYTLLGETSYQDLFHQVKEWYDQPRGQFLTEIHAKAMFCKIRSDKYWEMLERYNVDFKRNDFVFKELERIFHVIVKKEFLLSTIRIVRAFQNKTKIMCITPFDGIQDQRNAVEAFRSSGFTYLIIVSPRIKNRLSTKEISSKITKILDDDDKKKIILLAERNNQLVQEIGVHKTVYVVEDSVSLEDLTEETQTKLLKRKSITFQGKKKLSLEQLFGSRIKECLSNNLYVLENLITNKNIRIGSEVPSLDEDIDRYYICRKFKREKRHIKEENIYDVDEKVILIADSAGMGKTTVLKKLANDIKKKNPHLWVIRIELNEYTGILRNLLREKGTIDIMKLLNSSDATKFTNDLEQFMFSMDKKVVLLLDGVDEISPDYTNLVLSLLSQCLQAPNFAKIITTTRPHMIKELETHLSVRHFNLTPFTVQNQIDFLTNYWTHNLEAFEDKERCAHYARSLIKKVSSWVGSYYNKVNDFAAIPQQIRMLAEIFQENHRLDDDWEGCKEYLNGGGEEPDLPQEMVSTKLYETYIEKKREVFMDKGNPSGKIAGNQALTRLFDDCMRHHRMLALELVLTQSKHELFSSYQQIDEGMEENILKIGLVQKLGDDFHFIHRTYAEYFVAESLLIELQAEDRSVDFDRFLIDEVLRNTEYDIVRAFLDGFLQQHVNSLPCNIFEKYQCVIFNSINPFLIHTLSTDGFLAILKLILKSIDFKVVENKVVSISDILKMDLFQNNVKQVLGNTLNFLKCLTRHGGVNIKDNLGKTPLHTAKSNAVPFLLDHGADVNVTNNVGNNALYLAVLQGHYDVVKLLLEHGGDVNFVNDYGHTALHLACTYFDFDTVELLVGHTEDVNVKDKSGCTALHFACKRNNFDTIKLLVEHGGDVNIANTNGGTPFHVACTYGDFDVVKLLVETARDVNVTESSGLTPLHFALKRFKFETVKLLLERGADVNVRNKVGQTALHLAIEIGTVDVVKLLMEHGGDAKIEDKDGCTPQQLAVQYGEDEVVQLFA